MLGQIGETGIWDILEGSARLPSEEVLLVG